MCWVAEADFDRDVASPSSARHWVADHLERWGLVPHLDTAILLTSELVSNAVLHAASGPSVEVSVGSGFVEIGVSDSERRVPSQTPPLVGSAREELMARAESGRGLLLVEALADEWGATALSTGKTVWFRLRVPDWVGRLDCRCMDIGPEAVALRSGRRLDRRTWID